MIAFLFPIIYLLCVVITFLALMGPIELFVDPSEGCGNDPFQSLVWCLILCVLFPIGWCFLYLAYREEYKRTKQTKRKRKDKPY